MQKTHSFQRKVIGYILVIVSLTLAVGTLLVVSLVTWKLSQQNVNYTLSAFVKTDVELENQKDKMDTAFVNISTSLTRSGMPDIGSASLPYTKSLIGISNLFDQFLDYKMIGLFSSDAAIICSPVRSFSVHYSSDDVFSSRLYDDILHGEKDYGMAYMHEFITDSYAGTSSFWLGKVVYFRRAFLYGGKRYYILIGLDESVIHQSFLHLEQGFNSVYIVGQDSEIISSSHTDMFRRKLDCPIRPDSGLSYKETLGETEYQIIPQALGIYDWSIVNQYPTSEYMRDVNRMSVFIITIFIGCLAAVGLCVTLTIRRLSSPLNELSDRLKGFSSTGLHSPQTVLHTGNIEEFDILNKSFLQMADDIQRLVARQKEEEEQKNQFRIQALMAQINPHFICNALNTVKVMAEIAGNRNVATMIAHICQYISPAFRTKKNRWSYAEEYAFLEDYIYILEICFSAKMEIGCSFDPSIRDCVLPRFLIQPLIENSISHGMTQDWTLEIDVSVKKTEGGDVWIRVSDNGIGFAPEVLLAKKEMLANCRKAADPQAGIGLQNIKQRLNHYYPESHAFEIESAPNAGTAIAIRIPLQTNDASPQNGQSAIT